ncbi:MAG: ATP-binding protein [archaeon]|nr:ATP-binding protein [archaeon]
MSFVQKFLLKDASGVTGSDVESFIQKKIEENLNLDYTRIDAFNNKEDITKEVSSFANSDGGLMILGVEEKDENGHKVPDKITWGRADLSKEKLESILTSNVQPSIVGVRIFPIRNQSREVIFLIDIPQSENRPHMSSDHKYYRRQNFQKLPMQHFEVVEQIRRNETIRREHALFLIGAPLDTLRESIRTTDSGEILSLWAVQPDVFVTYSTHLTEPDTIEKGLLLSHIQSGYSDLYRSLVDYEKLFNEIAKEVHQIYSIIFSELKEVLAHHPIEWVSNPATMMQAFSWTVANTIARNIQYDLKLNTTATAYPLIALNNQAVISIKDQNEAGKIFAIFTSLPNHREFSRLREMWKKAQPLMEQYKSINKELQRMRIFVNQGVELKGSCDAGIEAGYEKPISM